MEKGTMYRFISYLGIMSLCAIIWSSIVVYALGIDMPSRTPIFALYGIIKEYPLECFMCWIVLSAVTITFITREKEVLND